MNVNKGEFIDQLIDEHNYTKKAATALVNDFLSQILVNLEAGNTVSFYGFGCFDMVNRAARSCPNPQTKEQCHIPAHWVPRFYPGESMRRCVTKWEYGMKKEVGLDG